MTDTPNTATHDVEAKLRSAKANGDPDKYAAFISVSEAHEAARLIRQLRARVAELEEAAPRLLYSIPSDGQPIIDRLFARAVKEAE